MEEYDKWSCLKSHVTRAGLSYGNIIYYMGLNGLEQNSDNINLFILYIVICICVLYMCIPAACNPLQSVKYIYTILGYIECINDLTRYIVIFTISICFICEDWHFINEYFITP